MITPATLTTPIFVLWFIIYGDEDDNDNVSLLVTYDKVVIKNRAEPLFWRTRMGQFDDFIPGSNLLASRPVGGNISLWYVLSRELVKALKHSRDVI